MVISQRKQLKRRISIWLQLQVKIARFQNWKRIPLNTATWLFFQNSGVSTNLLHVKKFCWKVGFLRFASISNAFKVDYEKYLLSVTHLICIDF